MTVLVVFEAIVIALLAVIVVGLLRSHAEILRRLHELGAGLDEDAPATGGVTSPVELRGTVPGVPTPRVGTGTAAHDLVGVTPDGSTTAIGVVGVDHTTLLVFLSSGCLTCRDFWEAFARGEAAQLPGHRTRLVVVTKSPEHESPSAVAALAPRGVTTLMSSEAYDDYGVPVSPYVILVDGPSGGVLGEGAAATWAQVANLLAQAAADAGLDTGGGRVATSADAASRSLADRERRADDELARAGIGPGHPSLYPTALTDDAVASGAGDPPDAAESPGVP